MTLSVMDLFKTLSITVLSAITLSVNMVNVMLLLLC
jgi:hypothetical protein